MKKNYHLCVSGDEEIMFRDKEDYHRGFNCFAIALYKTCSTGLAEAFMSTHSHQIIQTADPKAFISVAKVQGVYGKNFDKLKL